MLNKSTKLDIYAFWKDKLITLHVEGTYVCMYVNISFGDKVLRYVCTYIDNIYISSYSVQIALRWSQKQVGLLKVIWTVKYQRLSFKLTWLLKSACVDIYETENHDAQMIMYIYLKFTLFIGINCLVSENICRYIYLSELSWVESNGMVNI